VSHPPVPSVVYVPELAATLLELSDTERRAAAQAAVKLGQMVELDVAALEDAQADLAERIRRYWAAARALWASLAAGQEVSGVAVAVALVRAQQADTAAGRSDLRDELLAIEHMSDLKLAATILDASPDWGKLSKLGSLDREGNRSTVTVSIQGGLWPLCLGGPRRPGELRREVHIEANHATWRDRRVRRLRSLAVDAIEIWPDPAGF
jgi:hypothetical protein